MRSARVACFAAMSLVGIVAIPTNAQVFSSEFRSDPVTEGWELIQTICAETQADGKWYHQRFNPETCSIGSGAGQDAYVQWLTDFNGEPQFFLEFRIHTTGHRSEIPLGAPTVMVLFHSFDVIYHMTVASDLVKFARDIDLPIWFIEIEPSVPHTYRVELSPDRYIFYIDADLIDAGTSEGPFPAHDARITWLGASWELPAENAWDYIRYGVTPADGSGDYDCDARVTLEDFYFVHECLTNQRLGINGGPGQDAGPGCRFADFDFDSDVDMKDVAEFQVKFGTRE